MLMWPDNVSSRKIEELHNEGEMSPYSRENIKPSNP